MDYIVPPRPRQRQYQPPKDKHKKIVIAGLSVGVILIAFGMFFPRARGEDETLMNLHGTILEERNNIDDKIGDLVDSIDPIQDKIDVLEDRYQALNGSLLNIQASLQNGCWFWDEESGEFHEDETCDDTLDYNYGI